MLKFFIKIIVLLFLLLTISISILYLNPGHEYDYLSSIKQKLEKLQSVSSKKIVIIGGSSVNFGVDSEQIENSVKIPVINTGLHASLGPEFWINYVKDDLNSGDILIMSPEYVTLNKNIWYGMKGTRVPKTILYTPSKLKILFTDYEFFKKTTIGIFRTIKYTWEKYPFKDLPETYGVYDIRAFKKDNIDGKYLNRVYTKEVHKQNLIFNREKININKLKEFGDYFNEKNIDFYISPPSVINEKFDKLKARAFFDSIEKTTNIKILNKNSDYLFPRKYFNDTEYHLNKLGRELRSDLLAKDINEVILNKNANDFLPGKKKILAKVKKTSVKLEDIKNIHNSNFDSKINYLEIRPLDVEKTGFARYKTKLDLSKNIITFLVKGKREVIDKLHFRTLGIHKFNYISNIEEDIYSLCIDISNIDTKAKNDFHYYGLGFRANTMSIDDKFTIVGFNYYDNIFTCEQVLNNIEKNYSLNSKKNEVLFSIIKKNSNQNIEIKNILNINSNIEFKENIKYKIQTDNSMISIREFYSNKEIYSGKINTNLKFINSENWVIELIE